VTGAAAYIAKLRPAESCSRCSRQASQDAHLPYFGIPRCRADARLARVLLLRHKDLAMTGRLRSTYPSPCRRLGADQLHALISESALCPAECVRPSGGRSCLSVAWQALCKARHISISRRDRALFQGDQSFRVAPSYHRAPRHSPRGRHVVGIGPTMLAGIALVALSMVVMLRVTDFP